MANSNAPYAKKKLARLKGEVSALTTLNNARLDTALKKMEAITADTEYTKSKQQIALDRNGLPSVIAELGYYIGTDAGMELFRKGIQALLIQFAMGDKAAQKMIFGTAPAISQVDVTGLVGHIVGHSHQGALSPAELRRIEKQSVAIEIEGAVERKEPIEVKHYE